MLEKPASTLKQGVLEPWSWLKLEARIILVEIATRIEKEAKAEVALSVTGPERLNHDRYYDDMTKLGPLTHNNFVRNTKTANVDRLESLDPGELDLQDCQTVTETDQLVPPEKIIHFNDRCKVLQDVEVDPPPGLEDDQGGQGAAGVTGIAVDVPAQGAPQASSTKNEQPGMPVLNMISILTGTERVSSDKFGPPGDSRKRRASGVVQEEVERINNFTEKKVMKTTSTVKQMVAVMDDKAKLVQVTPDR